MSKKHTKRIIAYEEYRPFWHFFDKKAYIMMACMMGGGIGLCAAGLFRIHLLRFSIPAWLCLGIGRRSVCKKLFMLSQFDGKGTGSMREII